MSGRLRCVPALALAFGLLPAAARADDSLVRGLIGLGTAAVINGLQQQASPPARDYVDGPAPRRAAPPRLRRSPDAQARTEILRAEIQRRLDILGFDAGRPDGDFGPRTRRAIAAFQASIGRVPDGRLSPAEVAELYRRTGGPVPGTDRYAGGGLIRAPAPGVSTDAGMAGAPPVGNFPTLGGAAAGGGEAGVFPPLGGRPDSAGGSTFPTLGGAPASAGASAFPKLGAANGASAAPGFPALGTAAGAHVAAPAFPKLGTASAVKAASLPKLGKPSAEAPALPALGKPPENAEAMPKLSPAKAQATAALPALANPPKMPAPAMPALAKPKLPAAPADAAPVDTLAQAATETPYGEIGKLPTVLGIGLASRHDGLVASLEKAGFEGCTEQGDTLRCNRVTASLSDAIAVRFAADGVWSIARKLTFSQPMEAEAVLAPFRAAYPELMRDPGHRVAAGSGCGVERVPAASLARAAAMPAETAIADPTTVALAGACPLVLSLAFDGGARLTGVDLLFLDLTGVTRRHQADAARAAAAAKARRARFSSDLKL